MKVKVSTLLIISMLVVLNVVDATTTLKTEPTHEHTNRVVSTNFDMSGKSKLCLTPGPCYKKMLYCPKNCNSKLPGEGGDRRLVKNHFPGQCTFNCKKCIAHC